MKKIHEIKVRVSKDFKEMIHKVVAREQYYSMADFVRETLHKRITNTDRLDQLLQVMKNEETKNTKMDDTI
jgi:Arc/MetJ-type ribon-helix-helix transcriptional regulator